MGSPTRGLQRVVRAASLGFVGFVLALVAHLAAGGVAPAPGALLSLAGLVGLLAVLLTAARLGPVRLGLSLTAMQVVLHEVFMWLGAPAGCVMAGVSAPFGHMGHRAGPMPLVECATDMTHVGMGERSASAAAAMFGAHAAATVVMGALLAYGEKLLWLLAEWVRVPRWQRVGRPELQVLRIAHSGALRMFVQRFVLGGVGRRGPPYRFLFAFV